MISRVLQQLKTRYIWLQVQEDYTSSVRVADEESVLYNIYTTGVGRDYEIEGLASDINQGALSTNVQRSS